MKFLRPKAKRLVPQQRDFTDAERALQARRPTGRVNIGRGEPEPYWAVGESQYLDVLRGLQRRVDQDGRIPALLVREPQNPYDPNAVAVMIHGQVVGYLKRSDAADMKDALDSLAARGEFIACPAYFQGGTADKTNIGVVVEVPVARG